jgi:hypothetical protein
VVRCQTAARNTHKFCPGIQYANFFFKKEWAVPIPTSTKFTNKLTLADKDTDFIFFDGTLHGIPVFEVNARSIGREIRLGSTRQMAMLHAGSISCAADDVT